MRMIAPFLSLLIGSPEVAAPAVPYDAIQVIQCGNAVGTVWHIGNGRYLTAAHVIGTNECKIEGVPVKILKLDGKLDVAEIDGPVLATKVEIDCRPFKVNRHYLAVGYSMGIMRLELPLIFSAFGRDPFNGNGRFAGTDVHQGMSGGPLFGEDYRGAGIITQRWPSRIRALSDTHICQGKPNVRITAR